MYKLYISLIFHNYSEMQIQELKLIEVQSLFEVIQLTGARANIWAYMAKYFLYA